VTETHSKRPIA